MTENLKGYSGCPQALTLGCQLTQKLFFPRYPTNQKKLQRNYKHTQELRRTDERTYLQIQPI